MASKPKAPPGALRHFFVSLHWRIRAGLVLSALLGALLSIALATHSRTDPAFTTTGNATRVANKVGLIGAWVSDVAMLAFGWSVWWVPALIIVGLVGVFQRETASAGRYVQPRVKFWTGAAALLSSSCALEWALAAGAKTTLPGPPGGVLGHLLGPFSYTWLGSVGSPICWLVTLLCAAPMAFAFTWQRAAEAIASSLQMGITRAGPLARSALQHLTSSWHPARPQAASRKNSLMPAVPAIIDIPVLGAALTHEESLDAGWAAPAATADVQKPLPDQAEEEVQAELPVEPIVAPAPPAPAMLNPDPVVPPAMKIVTAAKPSMATIQGASGGMLPGLNLLDPPAPDLQPETPAELEATSRLIEHRLADFGVEVRVVEAYAGPVITRYEIEPATGVKGSQIVNLAKDLARSLSLVSIRVVETIPGKTTLALELPNTKRKMIRLSEVLGSQTYADAQSLLTIALGKDIGGGPVVADLGKMPHCLVAGTTGSGKSVGVNGMILSLLYKASPADVRLILIDPKMLEMSVYDGIPHLLCPVVTDMKQAGNALTWCVGEMEKRYRLMSKVGVRNLAGYNHKVTEGEAAGEPLWNPFSLPNEAPAPLARLPHVVVVIDELADLMMVVGKKVERLIARLAQKARAAGIHLVLATQRPSVDVITGLIKANIPARLSFQVSSKIDSRTVLDQMGAEALLGQGDMLFLAGGHGQPVRVHGAYVSDDEVHRVVNHLRAAGSADYVAGILEGAPEGEAGASTTGTGPSDDADPMYEQAVAVVMEHKRASISLVQRHLRIGYNRAARLLEQMEASGVVSAMTSNGNRELVGRPTGE